MVFSASRRISTDALLAALQAALLVLLPLLWFFHRLPDRKDGWHLTWTSWWLLAPLLLAFWRFVRREEARERGGKVVSYDRLSRVVRGIAIGWFTPFLLLWAVEVGLHAADVKRDLPPILFNSPEIERDDNNQRVLSHPVLLFTFNPGTVYNGEKINSMGYREREIDPVKAPGVRRVICLGDSITAQGRPNYSGILHKLLQEDPPGGDAWEAFNLGVYGYSSRQGLAVFREQARKLEPDFITVYFGPNDRNLHQKTDKMRMAPVGNGIGSILLSNYQDLRIGQVVLYAARQQALRRAQQDSGGKRVLRVPPDDYRHVMRRFVIEAREIGAEAILLTAPRRALSPGLISEGHARSLAEVTRLHDEYNAIVREVAAELKAPLVDLAEEMAGPEFDGVFAADGIHFDAYATEHEAKPASQPGLEYIAGAIHRKLQELVP